MDTPLCFATCLNIYLLTVFVMWSIQVLPLRQQGVQNGVGAAWLRLKYVFLQYYLFFLKITLNLYLEYFN